MRKHLYNDLSIQQTKKNVIIIHFCPGVSTKRVLIKIIHARGILCKKVQITKCYSSKRRVKIQEFKIKKRLKDGICDLKM